jgi:tetratricopeptide (TPR) repeat protein
MEALNSVKRILNRLSEEETSTARSYLTTFGQKGKEARAVVLFDLIAEQRAIDPSALLDAQKLELKIYGTASATNFSRLVYRLRDKILESLVLDVNSSREGVYDERTRINIEVRKCITQAQILQSRGLHDISESLLEKVIQQCKKYEILEELLLAIRLLINLRRSEDGSKFLKAWMTTYEKYDYMKTVLVKAEAQMCLVHAELDYKAGEKAKSEWLKPILDEMSTDYRKTSCAHIGFNYFYLQAQYYQLLHDYEGARKALQDNLNLLETHPSIFTKIRMGNVLSNIADNDLYLHQFNRSQKTASKALLHFKETSFNHQQAIELIFYAHYYRGDYKEARETILRLLPNAEDAGELLYKQGKRFYLLACTSFMLGDYNKALQLINRIINPIEADKEGWNAGLRILTIMTLIQLEKFDEATLKIGALKSFIDSVGKENFSERVLSISGLLRKLSNASFDFKIFFQKEKERIAVLSQIEWTPKSPEMILVDQWFMARANKRPLELILPAIEGKEKSPVRRKVTA